MPRFRLKTLFASVAIAAVLVYFHRPLLSVPAYVYAVYLEQGWTAARPQTMDEFESHINLYTKRSVRPSASQWAPNYHLKDGERMIQYSILGAADMEVVYDSNDRVIAIITSYE